MTSSDAVRPVSQLAFDLSGEASHKREDLIESPANSTAISMIDAWPDWPGSVTVLAGPVGSGKSHIASVWAAISNAAVIKADSLLTQNDELIHEAATGRPVMIEDMSGRTVDETNLFHLLNTIREAGGYCLITSRVWPREWGIELPDLASRLMAAQLVELQEPDDLLLKQVMVKLFADRQLQVDPSVIDYCALRMERSLEAASRLVVHLDRLALAQKSQISRRLAAKALQDLNMV